MTGIYVAVKYKNNIYDLNDVLLSIPNPVNISDLHTTLIYSRTYDNIEVSEYNTIVRVIGYEIWNTQDNKKALVAILEAPYLSIRHKRLMERYNLTYDYDEYKPHITLSYDIKDNLDLESLPVDIFLVASNEYKEDLDTP